MFKLLQEGSIEEGNDYIKFRNGIMMLWGRAECNAGESEATANFTQSFINERYVVLASHNWSDEAKGHTTVGVRNKSFCKILIYDDYNGINLHRHCDYLVIGRWK